MGEFARDFQSFDQWLDEAKQWAQDSEANVAGVDFTNGDNIDRLHDHWLANHTPLYAVMSLQYPLSSGLRPVAIPAQAALRKVERAYLKAQAIHIEEVWSPRRKLLTIIGLAVLAWVGVVLGAVFVATRSW